MAESFMGRGAGEGSLQGDSNFQGSGCDLCCDLGADVTCLFAFCRVAYYYNAYGGPSPRAFLDFVMESMK